MRFRSIFRCSLAWVVLAGCGDNLTGIPFASYDEARTIAECDRLVRCGAFPDPDTCRGYFRPRDRANLEAAISAGLVTYDGVAAEKCDVAIAAMSCDVTDASVRDRPPHCDEIFVGTARDGEDCALDEECASGDCMMPACERSQCCKGTCVHRTHFGVVGDQCQLPSDCSSGLTCDRDRLCRARSENEGPCDRDDDCRAGLGCTAAGIDPGFCRPLPSLGEPCPYSRCAQLANRCSPHDGCVGNGPGAPCANDSDCTLYGVCGTTGRCEPIPTLGAPCKSLCAGAAWCDDTAHLCADPKTPHTPCRTDMECASQYCAEGPIFDECAVVARCF